MAWYRFNWALSHMKLPVRVCSPSQPLILLLASPMAVARKMLKAQYQRYSYLGFSDIAVAPSAILRVASVLASNNAREDLTRQVNVCFPRGPTSVTGRHSPVALMTVVPHQRASGGIHLRCIVRLCGALYSHSKVSFFFEDFTTVFVTTRRLHTFGKPREHEKVHLHSAHSDGVRLHSHIMDGCKLGASKDSARGDSCRPRPTYASSIPSIKRYVSTAGSKGRL